MTPDDSDVWIAQLKISENVAGKINGRHAFSADDVHDAVVCRSGLEFVWAQNDRQVWRVILRVSVRGQWAVVVVYPDDYAPLGDVYHLATAYVE